MSHLLLFLLFLLTVDCGSGEFNYDAAVRQIIFHVAVHHAHLRILWGQERKDLGYVRARVWCLLKKKNGVEYSSIETLIQQPDIYTETSGHAQKVNIYVIYL